MNKIPVIIKREYITRVRKKSFIIMTILAPLLIAGLIVISMLMSMSKDRDFKKIAVIEKVPGMFRNVIKDTEYEDFVYLDIGVEELKKTFVQEGYYGILYISEVVTEVPNAVELISTKQPPFTLLERIEGDLEKEIERNKLLSHNIQNLDEILKSIDVNVNVTTRLIDDAGNLKETSTVVSMILAYVFGFLMYMLVFIFGSQVMRGVIEEKTSRVVEVVVSSVKPVQLMMGKIIGIALVGLTQFMIWIVLITATVMIVNTAVLKDIDVTQITQNLPQSIMGEEKQALTAEKVNQISPELMEFAKNFDTAMNQNWPLIIISFIFYFLTGYLLYASIFAAIGSAVDNETETQQFMLPVTIPIIIGLMVAMGTMTNPESSLSLWCSIIPLTSPIVMMARIPFGIPYWQLAVSMVLMVITFLAFVWMAAKIYRTGILMYGKKTSWKEMWKWLRYSG
ncbi:MAG: ABC transporter permease [Bacteroidales bacterium]|nr:ABC transporter permease [Bacteroidales bacterium]